MVKEVERYKVSSELNPHSRYNKLDRIRYEDGVEIIETADRIVIPRTTEDKYYTVLAGEEGRADIISNKMYGTPQLYWAILVASDISDPMALKPGDKLRIPPLGLIMSYKGVL